MIFLRSSPLSIILFVLLFAINNNSKANIPNESHELTLYVMPTMYPLDWSSPARLYKTMKTCYVKTIGLTDHYLLGHMAVKLESPLLDKPILIGQASGSTSEKTQLILKEKIGYGILGATLTGRIETEEELAHKIEVYARRGKLAFIKYRINTEAMQRVLTFIEKYTQKFNTQNAACDFYGGAFWPRYENEGGSCTSFGFSLLDVINIVPPTDYKWKLDLKIPQQLIGGRFNNNRKVKFSTIKKADAWHNGEGSLNKDFVKYSVYEPSIIFDWVLQKRRDTIPEYQAIDDDGVPGLYIDKTSVACKSNEPLFLQRAEPNLFIDVYLKMNGLSDKKN